MTALLLDALMRSTLLLLAGLAALFVLRRRSSALRHRILALTIAAAALAAPLGWIVPDWSIAAVPASAVPGFAAVSGPAVSQAVSAATPGPAPGGRDLLALFWALGAAAGLLSMCVQLLRLSRIAAGARPLADPRWRTAVAEVSARYGIGRPVPVLQTRTGDLVATWGYLRPRIFVPAGAARWTDERIRVVVCHELAHVRRRDWLLQMAADLARRLYWFQPLMWIACRQLRRESEHACDDMVLGTGVAADAYAGHLLQIARAGRSHTHWASAMPMARPSTLERRIAAMLNSARNRGALTHRSLVVSTLVLAVATLTAAALHPEQTAAGPLVGTIYDGSGGVLPGAEVTLTAAGTTKATVTTNAAGKFAFPATSPGKYALEVKVPGFHALRQDVELKQPADWDRAMTLQVGQLRETISVRAKREPATSPTPGIPGPTPVRVGGNIKAPTKLVNVNPTYPASMRTAGRSGTVPLEAIIGTEGSVVFVRVLSANVHPDFATAAVDAVRQWKFSPTLLNGKPVEVSVNVSIDFSLE